MAYSQRRPIIAVVRHFGRMLIMGVSILFTYTKEVKMSSSLRNRFLVIALATDLLLFSSPITLPLLVGSTSAADATFLAFASRKPAVLLCELFMLNYFGRRPDAYFVLIEGSNLGGVSTLGWVVYLISRLVLFACFLIKRREHKLPIWGFVATFFLPFPTIAMSCLIAGFSSKEASQST